jgi:hypothetical protein
MTIRFGVRMQPSDREFRQQQLSYTMEIQREILEFGYIYARRFGQS